MATVVAAGFTSFTIASRLDVFANAPQSSSAAKFGTLGINFRALRARDDDEWSRELQMLGCAT